MNIKDNKSKIRKRILLWLLGTVFTILLAAVIWFVSISSSLIFVGSIVTSLFGRDTSEDLQTEHVDDEDCTCGCIWVTTGNGTQMGTTGSTNTGQQVSGIPSAPTNSVTSSVVYNKLSSAKKKNLVYNMLPGAVLSYEIFGVYPSVVMGQKVQESTWTFKASNMHNYFGIKADSKWKDAGGDYHTVKTHEYINGKKVYVNADFRTYPSIEAGVLALGDFLRSNSRYENNGVFIAKTPREQLEALHRAGYATDPKYVTNIVEGIINPNNFNAFDNIEESKKLMQELGIYDKYESLKVDVISGKVVIMYKGGLSNIGGSSSIDTTNTGSGSNSSTVGKGTGYWIGCSCEVSCPLCDCHDGDNNGVINGATGCEAWNMAESKPGDASGIFGDREYLEGLIDKLGVTYKPIESGVTTNIVEMKKQLKDLLDDMGKPSSQPYRYKVDKFQDSNQTGYIQYNQNRKPGEDYVLKGYQGGKTKFLSSACGIYSVAMVLSTLERKYINPAEVAIAVQTLPVRLGKNMNTTQLGSNTGALYSSAAVEILKVAGYNTSVKSSLVQSEIDSTLDKGGLVIGVFMGKVASGSQGHFMVIRDKDTNGKYLMGDSVKRNDTSFTFKDLKGSHKHTVIHVLPKDGKSVFDIKDTCKDINANVGTNNGVGASSNDTVPYHPLAGKGTVSSNLFRSGGSFHGGIDMSAPANTPIYAMWDGEVLGSGFNIGLGYYVSIKHNNGYYTTSAHMIKASGVKKGAKVKKGDLIGYVGNTGNSTGNHLHIEILTNQSRHVGNGLFSSKQFIDAISVLNAGGTDNLCVFVKVAGNKGKIIKKGTDFDKYAKNIKQGYCIVGS